LSNRKSLLRAIFEGVGIAPEEGERFAGEMELARDEGALGMTPGRFERGRKIRSDGAGESEGGQVGDQLGRRQSAFGTDVWKKEPRGNRCEGARYSRDIFFSEHSENYGGAFVGKLFVPSFGEHLRAGGIMGAVDDGAFVPALKTGGPFDRG